MVHDEAVVDSLDLRNEGNIQPQLSLDCSKKVTHRVQPFRFKVGECWYHVEKNRVTDPCVYLCPGYRNS